MSTGTARRAAWAHRPHARYARWAKSVQVRNIGSPPLMRGDPLNKDGFEKPGSLPGENRHRRLPPQRGRPVGGDRYGSRGSDFHQESAIESDVEIIARRPLKQRDGTAHLERSGVALDGDGHHGQYRIEVEELFDIATPTRRGSTARRNLQLDWSVRKRLDVDFPTSCLVGLVRDPTTVW